MAWTISNEKTVLGNKQVRFLKITTDSAEANIDTGLDVVDAFSMGWKSLTAATFKLAENVDSSGTASKGKIGASGLTGGDEFFLVCYGR